MPRDLTGRERPSSRLRGLPSGELSHRELSHRELLHRGVLSVLLVVALLATAVVPAAGAGGSQFAVGVTTSCLLGNGRVDVVVAHEGFGPVRFVISLAEKATGRVLERWLRLEHREWTRRSITGRPNGEYVVEVTSSPIFDHELVDTWVSSIEIQCDEPSSTILSPEIQLTSACRSDDGAQSEGVVTAQFANASSETKPYVLDVDGLPGRSTTVAAAASGFRAIEGLADGAHEVRVRSNGRRIYRETVTIDCTGGDALGTVEYRSPDEVTDTAHIAIGSDGNPIVAVNTASAFGFGSFKLIFCEDRACRGAETDSLLVRGREDNAGNPLSVAVGPDGHPVVAFFDGPDYRNYDVERPGYGMAVMVCSDPRCHNFVIRYFGPEPFGVPDLTAFGNAVSVNFASNGYPLISYYGGAMDFTQGWTPRLAACSDAICTEVTIADVDLPSATPRRDPENYRTDLLIGPDGSPIIVTNETVIACDDPSCETAERTTFDDEIIDASRGPNGFPLLLLESDHADGDSAFALISCSDQQCSKERQERSWLDSVPARAQDLALAASESGGVVITYSDPGLNRSWHLSPVTLMHCDDAICADPTTAGFPLLAQPAVPSIFPDGQPALLTRASEQGAYHIVACEQIGCVSTLDG